MLEGVHSVDGDNEWGGADCYYYFKGDNGKSIDGLMYGSPQTAFSVLWNAINGPGAWDRNDYVWAYGLERVT
jgi:hypothetical protein